MSHYSIPHNTEVTIAVWFSEVCVYCNVYMFLCQIEKVHKFVSQVNQVMHQREEHERLKMIIDRIEVYDIIDTPNIEEVQKVGSLLKLNYKLIYF